MMHFSRKTAWLFLALAGVCGCQWPPADTARTWERKADSLALRQDGQIVWRFNFGTNEAKPNFHPLSLPGGPVLSCYRPTDHPWHRGLWFSWKYINHVNYWEEDRKTGVAQGTTEWSAQQLETHRDFSARLTMDLKYHPAHGPVVLVEHRVITVSAPDKTGAYNLDWTMTFKAVGGTVLLDRAPPVDEKGNNVSGGYAGLGLRAAADFRDAEVITSEGPVQYENYRFRGKSPALDFSGTIGDRTAGVAFLDCNSNLNAPTPWYVVNRASWYYISPAVLTFQPETLQAGEGFTLRYRVAAHPGRWTTEQLRLAADHYGACR
jgi:hypothetical protein